MWNYVGWPEYVTAIFMLTSGFIAVNWIWIERRLPSTRFKELEPLIASLDQQVNEWRESGKDSVLNMAQALELRNRLRELKVRQPESIAYWHDFIPLLLSECRQGNYRAMRNAWRNGIEAELGGIKAEASPPDTPSPGRP